MLQMTHQSEKLEFTAAAMSSIGDGVIVTDRKGTVQYINPAGEKLTGWSEKEAVGKLFGEVFQLVDFFTGRELDSPIKTTLKYGMAVGLKNHSALLTKRGEKRFVSANCAPIRISDSKTEGAVIVFRDIDRIKNMEQAVTKEKNNLRKVLEALSIGIALVEEDAVVQWVNDSLLNIFHIQEEDLLGRRIGDGTHCVYSYEKGCGEGEICRFCEILKNVRLALQEDISREQVTILRSYLIDDEEKRLWLNIRFVPLATAEKRQVLLAIEDISEQKEHEAMLKRSRDEAESANKIKSEFLANMSHEIRTPLNGLIGMMDLLSISHMDEEQTEYIQMARACANTLLKMINNILDLSRIEAGKISVSNRPFEIKSLMNEMIKIHTVLAEKKGLRLQYDMDTDLPQYVNADPDRLRQILNNLLGNAVKFTDTGEIRVTVHKSRDYELREWLEFRILDTGVGISAEKMDLLFRRFSQIDGSVTRRHNGTGLGLAICKQLAELMGGTIYAESQVGRGSTFVFKIRVNSNEEPGANSFQNTLRDSQQISSTIVFNDSEFKEFLSDEAVNREEDRIVILNQNDSDVHSSLRLDENGAIVFCKTPAVMTEEVRSRELERLKEAIWELKRVIAENKYSLMEGTAHKVKKIAIRLGKEELKDQAFKIMLAARKQEWRVATEYGLKIINEISFSDEEV